jgi:hypothetical protein
MGFHLLIFLTLLSSAMCSCTNSFSFIYVLYLISHAFSNIKNVRPILMSQISSQMLQDNH